MSVGYVYALRGGVKKTVFLLSVKRGGLGQSKTRPSEMKVSP